MAASKATAKLARGRESIGRYFETENDFAVGRRSKNELQGNVNRFSVRSTERRVCVTTVESPCLLTLVRSSKRFAGLGNRRRFDLNHDARVEEAGYSEERAHRLAASS